MQLMKKIHEAFKNFFSSGNNQKLLVAPIDIDDEDDEEIDLTNIYKYLHQDKYQKELSVKIEKLKQSKRKQFMNRIDSQIKGIINTTHDNFPLIEGSVSGQDYISVRRKNVQLNKVGQTIILDNGYVDISTRKKSNENIYANLYYKRYIKGEPFEDLLEYDSKNETYSRIINGLGINYSKSVSYASEDDIAYIENEAQPSNDERAIKEYLRLTNLEYVSSDEESNIWNAVKFRPYLVKIEVKKIDKNNTIVHRKAVSIVYKSKKECIVGYRPTMIYLEDSTSNGEKTRMYRLLENGTYANNNSFKLNFDGKYVIKTITLDEIQKKVREIPLTISTNDKNILRNGYEIPNYIKQIYEIGLSQIHNMGLDRVKKDDE